MDCKPRSSRCTARALGLASTLALLLTAGCAVPDEERWPGTALVEVRPGLILDPVDRDRDGFPWWRDCDDLDPTVPRGGPDYCDGVDSNCDGISEPDADGDGWFACEDCDDSRPDVYPGARDDACDGDNRACTAEESDADGDGWPVCAGDCDDDAPATYPGAAERCDAADNDCDEETDEGLDLDGDGFLGPCDDCDDDDVDVFLGAIERCDGKNNGCGSEPPDTDIDGDGYGPCDGDCLEHSSGAAVNPGMPDSCNGIDDDCDGVSDNGHDLDGDGVTSCGADGVPGTLDDDCMEQNPGIPGPEICDGVDQDCDGAADEDFDVDGDGATTCGVDGVLGTLDDDCDDADPARAPGIVDYLDGTDNDCDGLDTRPAPTPSVPTAEELRAWMVQTVWWLKANRTDQLRGAGCARASLLGGTAPPDSQLVFAPENATSSWTQCTAGPELGGGLDADYFEYFEADLQPQGACVAGTHSGEWVVGHISTPGNTSSGVTWSGGGIGASTGLCGPCLKSPQTWNDRGGDLVVVRDVGSPAAFAGLPEGTTTWSWEFSESSSAGSCSDHVADSLSLSAVSHATTTPWTTDGDVGWWSGTDSFWGTPTGCTLEPSSGVLTASAWSSPGGAELLTVELSFGGPCDGCVEWSVDGVGQPPWCTTDLDQ